MITAKHHPLLWFFFKNYAVLKIKRCFHTVEMHTSTFIANDVPLLLIGNHTGWWDGFWAFWLNKNSWNKRFHFMMLEKELRKHIFFRFTGGFSIAPSQRSMIESLHYASSLLQDAENLVLLYPQGKLQSLYLDSFVFQQGVERIMHGASANTKVVFYAALIEYMDNPKPSLHLYSQLYPSNDFSALALQKAYSEFYQSCLEQQKLLQK